MLTVITSPLLSLRSWLNGAVAMIRKSCAVEGLGSGSVKLKLSEIGSEKHYRG